MKKILIALTFIASFAIFQTASATSGTCSYHGGINCNAGSDWDGSTVCNDGWRDSSEQYFSAQGCMNAKHYCTKEEFTNLAAKTSIIQEEDEVRELTRQLNQLIAESKASDNYSSQGISQSAINGLREQDSREFAQKSLTISTQLQAAQGNLRLTENQLGRECLALGEARFYKEQKEFIDSLQKQRQDISNTIVSCPANASLNSGSCYCNEGYTANGQGCVTYTQNCQSKYGPNSYGDKSTCRCLTDYSFDASKNICVKNEDQPNIPAKNKPSVEMAAPKEAEKKQVKPIIKNKETGEIIPNNAIITPSAGEAGDRSEPPKKQNFVGKIFSSIKNFIFNIFK